MTSAATVTATGAAPGLRIRVQPRGTLALRSAWATCEVTVALVVAHTAAGGSLPSLPWIAMMAATVFVAGLVVLRGTVRPVLMLPALIVAQLGLHVWLMALTPPAAEHHGAHPMAMGSGVSPVHLVSHMGWGMVLAHVAGAAATALAWELRRRAVDVLVSWSEPASPTTPLRRDRLVSPQPRRAVARDVLLAAPRRGPPRALAAA